MSSPLFDGNTYKGKWESLLTQNSIRIGNQLIQKNTNPNYGTAGNLSVKGSNALTEVIQNATAATLSPFRDPGGGTSGQLGSTLIGQFNSAQFGRYQVGETIDGFLVSSGLNSLGNSVGSAMSTVSNGIGAGVSGVAQGVGNFANTASKQAGKFVAPVKECMDTLKKLGEDFDKIIKDTFLGQIFKIKGSEIICAIFCIVISFLPCKVRSQLYDAIVAVKQGLATANSAIDSINSMTKTAVEVPLFNEKTLSDNIKSLFPNKLQNTKLDKAISADSSQATKKPIPVLEVPSDVRQIINSLVMVLSVLAKGQISVPVGITGDIWAFAQTVLSIVQQVVIQMVDEFLTKTVKDIEKMLKSMIPQMCVGNLAAKFINKIIEALNTLKDFLIDQLGFLLGDSSGFKIKWKKFGWYFKEITELLAILKALNLVLKQFSELSLLCGISPCNNLPSKELKDIQDAIQSGMQIDETNIPARLVYSQVPQGKTLDELADTFRTMTGQPSSYVVQADNGFHVILPDMFKNAPTQINNIINSGEFLSALGGAYSLYPQQDSGISVVYTYELKC